MAVDDKAQDDARVINLDDYRRAKFGDQNSLLEAAKGRHPAFRAQKAREEAENDKNK